MKQREVIIILISLNELSEVKGIGKKTLQRIREYKLKQKKYVSEYDKNLHLDKSSINLGDCLELMNGIKDNSVDMVLCDLPYQMTSCNWDNIIDLDKLWQQYERIIKDDGAIVLTSSQPFTTKLINSNIKLFKYEWIWEKSRGSNFVHSKYRPLKVHENILVFSKKPSAYNSKKEFMKYNPQMKEGKPYNKGRVINDSELLQGKYKEFNGINKSGKRFPRSKIYFKCSKGGLHPTQKPVELFRYLIRTYTNKGDLVLDNTSGSGVTAISSMLENRNYICIEKSKDYYDKSVCWRDLVEQGVNYKKAMKKTKKHFDNK